MFGSAAIGKKAGVLVLIHRNLACKVEGVQSDSIGRKVTAFFTIGEQKFAVTNIYAPNQQSGEATKSITDWVLTAPDVQHIVGSDFNDVMSMTADRKKNLVARRGPHASLRDGSGPCPDECVEAPPPGRPGIHALLTSQLHLWWHITNMLQEVP